MASIKYGESVGSPPENCTDICRRGLIEIALSSSVLISSQVSSCTNPTWLASIKHGSHHIAAVGQVDGEHRTAAVRNRAAAMAVKRFIVMRADISPRKNFFKVTRKGRINGHQILEMPVLWAILDHPDLAIALNNLRFDLADRLLHQDAVVDLAVQDLFANLRDAARAQRIGLARPAERRLGLLVTLQQRFVGPLRRE